MSAPPRQYHDDGLVQLDRHAPTLRRYHFPPGTRKSFRAAIRGTGEPLWILMQRFRLWAVPGSAARLPLDIRRPLFKTTLVTVDVPGSYPRPAFTRCIRRSSWPCSTRSSTGTPAAACSRRSAARTRGR